ncbi:CaiB/BaiF CoA transferase family protein [Natronosalvus halobius]|uniref:CaiB/BaiF CoA transferase family protein n=1 Tax=Natronosalvus halobius TaxID=2953746 RepID=UPI00209F6E13|nr:CaiB/BaiF CoA-transferase family protein [Natronosalvus halobius]USZ73601.1 CoA transferase [Natronosalvus halobius]
MSQGPLSDVSVLELSTMIAGPYAGQLLGDLGADVVKIERPGTGELSRTLEPSENGHSFYYLTANRNKRSLALDVTREDGREVFMDLVASADVVLENFPPTFTDNYDIGYEAARERNDEIIYCSISAYGETGPYRTDLGIDTTIQALSGTMSMAREEGGKPMRTGVPLNDIFASLYAVQGILTALYNRRETGEGEFVDVSLLDAGVAGLVTRATYSFFTGEPYPPFGRRHNYFAPEGVYEVSDGDVQLSVVTDRHWRRFCEAIDAPELAAELKFETVNDRVENVDDLEAALAEKLGEWTVDDLVDTLQEANVPAAPINDTVSVWDHPQVRAREMRQSLEHPEAGEIDTLGFPVKYDDIEQSIDQHPPILGEHTETILEELGYEEDDVEALVDDGTVEQSD